MGPRPLYLLILTLLVAGRSAAQEQSGAIEGVVRDASGEVLVEAVVAARGPSLPGVARAATDSKGIYRFAALPPGAYEVSCDQAGFSRARMAVELTLGKTLQVDLVLQPAPVEEAIEVTAEGPSLDVRQSASFVTIRGEWIEKLPKGRDYISLVPQAAGANLEDKLFGISIDGAAGSENLHIIDGVDTSHLRLGIAEKNLNTDFIEEVQVKSSGFEAEFGGSTGGVINVITRTGGNDFRGEAGFYFTSNELSGQPRPSLRSGLVDNTRAEYVTYPKDDFTRWEPGFLLGGPVLRDRLWFFSSYMPRLRSTDRTVTFRANGETGTFHQGDRTHFSTSKLSAQITSKMRVTAALHLSAQYTDGQLPAQSGTSNPATRFAELGSRSPNTSFSSHLDYVASEKLFFSIRGGQYRSDFQHLGVPNEVRHLFIGSNRSFPEIPESLRRDSFFSDVLSNFATTRDLKTRTLAGADATYYASLAGQHTFKAGVELNRPGHDILAGFQQPQILLFWDRTLTTLDGRRVRGAYGYYTVTQGLALGDVASRNLGFFVQDSWTVRSRLTLNLGLRTEQEKVPSYTREHGEAEHAIEFGFIDKLAPRLGFAWDVRGDGKWKAYGSWGLFYDITKLTLPLIDFGGNRCVDFHYSLDTFDWPRIGVNGYFPGTLYQVVDNCPSANNPAENRIDPDLRPMRSREMTFGLERELSKEALFALRYVRKRLDRALEDVGFLRPGTGVVYLIANPGFGLAEHPLGEEFPAQPKASREYDGLELRLRKRLSHRWALQTSYVWSRLHGNYSGLASSDPLGGPFPNLTRFFDSIYMSFDQDARPVHGPLGTDRPHRFKAQAIFDFPFGTSAGVNYYLASGTPVSRYVNLVPRLPVFYSGRLSDGRTPAFSQTDLYLRHDVLLPGGRQLRLAVNVLNLFDQDTVTDIYVAENRDNIFISSQDFFRGFDVQKLIAEQGIARDPLFLRDSAFQSPREVRFEVKFVF